MKIVITTLFLAFIFPICLSAQVAEIPFVLDDKIILIELSINDNTNTNTFVFDTGATSDLIDSTAADKLGLKANYEYEVSGAGGMESYDIILSQKLIIQPNIEINNTNLVITDLTKLNDGLQNKFAGIIGYSLLKKYVTKIDYENQKISLYNKIENVDISDYISFTFEFTNGIPIPQFDISITLRNGELFTGKVFFDTGASLPILISTPYNKQYKISDKAGKSLISKSENLSIESIYESIAIAEMNLGGYKLNEMVAYIAHDKEGVSSYENYLGILGADVISRFNIILDYSTSTLYLKPNNTFNNLFNFPLSGIKLKKVDNNIVIKTVEKTSSAYKKGIREGDELISVNGNSSGNIKTYREFLKKENHKVHLTFINSKGEVKKIEIELKRLL